MSLFQGTVEKTAVLDRFDSLESEEGQNWKRINSVSVQ